MNEHGRHLLIQGDARRIPLASGSVDLVFGSPPYIDCRTYIEEGRDLEIARGLSEWIPWMLDVTTEALRVSRGAVLWVAAGKTKDRNYLPACEGLIWEWHKRGGHSYRPCYWHRVGIPGSGGDQWLRSDVEHVMCFKRPGTLEWADNTAMGKPADWPTGGPMSYRDKNGVRRNSLTVTSGYNGGDATTRFVDRKVCEIANPGNFHEWDFSGFEQEWYETAAVEAKVGGGHLGSFLAHENEAPFPEALAEFFVRSFCPPGGLILDPFSGSGTTAAVALKNDRRAIGLDLRMSQCELGRRRIADALRPVSRLDAPPPRRAGAGQLDLFAEAAP